MTVCKVLSDEVSSFISKLRDIFPPQVDSVWIGKNGKCYQVALLLKHAYPSAEIYYSATEGHVYTKIDERWYDIEGIHVKVPEDVCLLDHKNGHPPHRWHKSFWIHDNSLFIKND